VTVTNDVPDVTIDVPAEDATTDFDSGADRSGGTIDDASGPKTDKPRINRWVRALVHGVLPGFVLVAAIAAGYLKWLAGSAQDAQVASIDALNAAKDSTVAMLTYTPDNVEANLDGAQARLTGTFKDSYASLVHDVVIPGSRQQRISAEVKIAAAAPVSADARHAVVLIFVNQTTTIGGDPPSDTASSVRVALDNVNGHWLISQFDPI
jgi:Mce-associated membrane protein